MVAAAVAQAAGDPIRVRVGSKKFTESVILGEMIGHLAASAGASVIHRRELGGTRVLWNALVGGDLDAYPEYTGTITEEIFAARGLHDLKSMRAELAANGVRMSDPLGFNNTYALGVKKGVASRFDLHTITDLRREPDLRFGFTAEFIDRADGWPSLRDRYRLPQTGVRALDHDLAYRGLDNGSLDVIDLYATDAEIRFYDLLVLDDDLHHFVTYDAVILYRVDLATRAPEVVDALMRVQGRISAEDMIRMNARAKLDKVAESEVAADFVNRTLHAHARSNAETVARRIWRTTQDHLLLVVVSMVAAIFVAVPLGVLAAKKEKLGQSILAVVGVIQTIPSLALLVLLMEIMTPLRRFGIEALGAAPAIVALFLYSLLPIVRNTYTGLHDIPIAIQESATALGLAPAAKLWLIELPMASRSILAGIKTSAVINVGFATLGALIGAGGYGEPILSGIRLADSGLILQGALPAAALSLLVQGLFELAERFLVPRGLRLKPEG
ncbi:MAG: glycine betaine ABC transporter substrate-binding protein [Phycisphaerae bacterium]